MPSIHSYSVSHDIVKLNVWWHRQRNNVSDRLYIVHQIYMFTIVYYFLLKICNLRSLFYSFDYLCWWDGKGWKYRVRDLLTICRVTVARNYKYDNDDQFEHRSTQFVRFVLFRYCIEHQDLSGGRRKKRTNLISARSIRCPFIRHLCMAWPISVPKCKKIRNRRYFETCFF